MRGQEVFIHCGYGAHTPAFRVLTWRRGRLVAVPDPSGEPTAPMWAPDASLGYGTGYRLTVRGPRRYLSITRARRADDEGYAGTTLTYRWRAGAWRRVSLRPVTFANAQIDDHFGWRVRGHPAWPSDW